MPIDLWIEDIFSYGTILHAIINCLRNGSGNGGSSNRLTLFLCSAFVDFGYMLGSKLHLCFVWALKYCTGCCIYVGIFFTGNVKSGSWLVANHRVMLNCFSPDPSLTWSKVEGSMPISRYTIVNYNTELTIWNVQKSDEGDYRCRASNANDARDHIIQIDVQGEQFVFMTECL